MVYFGLMTHKNYLISQSFLVFLQIYINQNIDFVLAIFLIISSSIGAAIASRIIDKFDQENLKVLFGVLLVIIASFLIYELFRTPIELFKINYV